MRFLTLAVVVAIGSASPTQAKTCTGLNARYEMQGAKGFILTLVKAKQALAWSDLEAELITPTRRFEFTFTASNGYSTDYMVQKDIHNEGTDEAGNYPFHGFDKNLTTTKLPQSTTPAPMYVFTPELGGSLWYGPEPREFLPMAMWRLKSCK
jgi:hypothetical protein